MNRSVHLEFACQARRSCKVTFLSQIGNGPEVPIGKYPECTGTSTLDLQEDVDKRISQPGAALARLLPKVDGTAWDDLEDEAKLSAFAVPSNPLLVDAIPRRCQRNDRQQIGSKQRARANTASPGPI